MTESRIPSPHSPAPLRSLDCGRCGAPTSPRSFLLLLPILFLTLLSSCVRDELPDCPPLAIEITVTDKNYENVDDVEFFPRRDENLPFRDYVSTLCWTLTDFQTGKIVGESEIHSVEGDARSVSTEFPAELPYGKYIFTVWGNLEDEGPLGDDPASIDFHPEGRPGADVYVTCDTLDYQYGADTFRVGLERTKGKLLVCKENLPPHFTLSQKNISGLFSSMKTGFRYDGSKDVAVVNTLPGLPEITSETVLAPSIKKDGSVLSLSFSAPTRADHDSAKADDVRITMERNRLTVVKYVWHDETSDFSIHVLVGTQWHDIIHLDLD